MDDLLYTHPAYRLARIAEMLSAGQRSIVPMTAGVSKQLLPANTRRVSFTLAMGQGTNLTIWVDSTVASGKGLLIDPTQLPRTFSVESDGPWVQSSIWAVAAGATISLAVIETAIIDGDFDPSGMPYRVRQNHG